MGPGVRHDHDDVDDMIMMLMTSANHSPGNGVGRNRGARPDMTFIEGWAKIENKVARPLNI